jgi:TusA-related sulfurtransferase
MEGRKMESAKIAMVMLCEALKDIAKIRIVLFTGDYNARNILVKDFGEIVKSTKFDKFGRHSKEGNNLDGISIKNEAKKLNKNEIIVVISDGQPAGRNYSLNDAIHEIHDVTKKFKVFAFSIDAQGDHLNKLYGDNWILTSSSNKSDLGEKLIKFCRLLVKEFYR